MSKNTSQVNGLTFCGECGKECNSYCGYCSKHCKTHDIIAWALNGVTSIGEITYP